MIFGCFEDCVLYLSVFFNKENNGKMMLKHWNQGLPNCWTNLVVSYLTFHSVGMIMIHHDDDAIWIFCSCLTDPSPANQEYSCIWLMTLYGIFQGGKPPTRLGWGGPGVSKIGLAKTPWWLTGLNHDENEVATGEADRTNVQEGNVKPISWRSEIQNVDPFWSLFYALEASVGLFIRQGIGSRLRMILRIRYPLPRRVLTAVAATELFHPRKGDHIEVPDGILLLLRIHSGRDRGICLLGNIVVTVIPMSRSLASSSSARLLQASAKASSSTLSKGDRVVQSSSL